MNNKKEMKNEWVVKWREDIDKLAVELPNRHKNLFFQLKENHFYKAIDDLKKNLKNYDGDTIMVEIAKIVSSVRDAHTTAVMTLSKALPLKFYWFADGIYIVNAINEYTELINCKLEKINDIPIDEVVKQLSCIVSHENDFFLKSQLPLYIPAVEALYGLGILGDFENVKMSIRSKNSDSVDIIIPSYSFKELNGMINSEGESENDLPLYRRNTDKNYWTYFIEEYNLLYFNYNSCRDMDDIGVEDFCTNLTNVINKENVTRVVIDLRNNLGGNSTLLDPFIKELKNCAKLNNHGGIFVIIGIDTFSSALLNAYAIKNKTKAIFVGEPSGGKPNCYGEVQYFNLDNSKIQIRYSTEYYHLIKNDKEMSLFPDVNMALSSDDYIKNIDPCMKYILEFLSSVENK